MNHLLPTLGALTLGGSAAVLLLALAAHLGLTEAETQRLLKLAGRPGRMRKRPGRL